jgi:hypothetical protein
MPGRPRTIFSNIKINEEELREKAELFYLNEAQVKQPRRPRKEGKTSGLMQDIYEMFTQASEQAGKNIRLPATTFQPLYATHAVMTVNRAKKVLGIRSLRKSGKWWWTFPLHAPTEALEKVHQRRVKEYNPYLTEMKYLRRPIAQKLTGILIDNGNEMRNTQVLRLMEMDGYSRATVLVAKAKLGIISRKHDGVWVWYYIDERITTWLIDRLASGPVPEQQLFIEALDDHNWSEQVVRMAKKVMPHIQLKYNRDARVMSWMDINAAIEDPEANEPLPEESRIVDVDNEDIEELDLDGRTITVDFSTAPVEHDLAPDDEHEQVDDTVVDEEEIMVNGVKIVRFI